MHIYYEGTLAEFELVSYNRGSTGPAYKPPYEYEQRLTITRAGDVDLKCYTYGSHNLCRKEIGHIDAARASALLDELAMTISRYDRDDHQWTRNNGEWNLILENTKGDLFRATGRLCLDVPGLDKEMSDRIRELTGVPTLYAFDGGLMPGRRIDFSALAKVTIKSNTLCYGPRPDPDTVIEQRLTISDSGRIWLSSYAYGAGYPYLCSEKLQSGIGKETAWDLLVCIGQCFSEYEVEDLVTDIGSWDLTLWDRNGNKESYSGSLCSSFDYEGENLSAFIRQRLGREDLFLFDRKNGETMND